MPRYLWLRIGIVARGHRGIAGPDRAARLARSPAPADQPGPGPPGRHPPGPWRRPREGHRERAGPHGRRPAAGAPEEGDRRPGHAPGARGGHDPAVLAAGDPGGAAGARQLRRVRHAVHGPRGGPDRAHPQGEGDHRAPELLRRPGAQGDPEPRRPVRRGGADDPEAGRQSHPRAAAGRPGSRPGEGADRQDGGARVQAAGRPGRRGPRRSRKGRLPATRSSTAGAWTGTPRPRRACPTSSRRRSC